MKGEAVPMRRPRQWLVPTCGIAALSAVSAVGTAGAPFLLRSAPLVLVALSPRLAFQVVAARRTGLLPFLAVVVSRLLLGDPLHFLLGRHGGAAAARRWPRAGAALRHAQEVVESWGLAAVAVRPVGVVLAAAGMAGMPGRTVALADLGGTLVQALILYQCAQALGGTTQRLASALLALVAVLAVVSKVRGPRARSRGASSTGGRGSRGVRRTAALRGVTPPTAT